MAIVRMSRLKLAGLRSERELLLRELQKLGCVELESPATPEEAQEWLTMTARDEADDSRLRAAKTKLTAALAALDRYAPAKGGLFSRRPEISVDEFFSVEDVSSELMDADAILEAEASVKKAIDRHSRLINRIRALEPWTMLDVPLNCRKTACTRVILGTLPAGHSDERIKTRLDKAGVDYSYTEIASEEDTSYLRILVYKDEYEEAWRVLRQEGLAEVDLPAFEGTVPEALAELRESAEKAEAAVRQAETDVAELAPAREKLRLAVDRVTRQTDAQEARTALMVTESAFYTEGWVPTESVPRLKKLLDGYNVSWEVEEVPFEESTEVPTKLKNNVLTRPLNMVTDMYSLPAYGTIDPNPLMAPFFVVFYGLMMADMAYGILMILAGILILKAMHPRQGMKNLAGIAILCGITTFIFGAMTGGFFGDFIPQLAKLINPNTTLKALPSLFTPLNDTLMILVGSLALGVVQIVVGMIVSIVYKAKHGDFVDALFDEITWFVILAGIALAVLGVGNVRGIPVCLIIGCLMLVFGGTRKAKGFGKLTSLVGLIYNGVTGYFSDILSYARIMALMLAGSVIAMVFNTLGSVSGNVVVFVIISLIGNLLNLVLNLLGCYVHDLRLQCLEFFNRFYHEGGRVFRPLKADTQYVDIIDNKDI